MTAFQQYVSITLFIVINTEAMAQHEKIGKLVLAGSILNHKLAHFVQAVEKIGDLLSTRALLIAELSVFCRYGIENLLFVRKISS